ncbi:LruC domain-containing protein [Candidatus Dependentiae bacterium]|nr:LruC domain-containing protein [Candidatus Dependentiae bacterium]
MTYSVFSNGGALIENNGAIIMQAVGGQSIASDSNIFYNADLFKTAAGYSPMIDIEAPDSPVLISPADAATSKLNEELFQWASANDYWSGINYYRFQLAADSYFNNINIDSVITSETNIHILFNTAYDTENYYWRIIAVDNFYNTSVSEIRRYTRVKPDNIPPSAVITLSDTGLYSGQSIHLTAVNSFDFDGQITGYKWFQRNIEISNDSAVTIIFSDTGTDSVILIVYDDQNGVDTATKKFNITLPALNIEQTVNGVRPDNFYYTLAFEDLFPDVGDGDYNDFVTDLNITREINENNEIKKIIITAKALSRGAGYDHQFKIKLNFRGSASIERSLFDSLGRWRAGSKQNSVNSADLILFDSTKAAFNNAAMPNVNKNQTYIDGQSVKLEITFANPQLNNLDDADTPPYNPYLYVKDTNREIYLNSVDENGYPFALKVPSNWGWPLEGNQIDSGVKTPAFNVAYPLFRDWRESGYNSKINWYDFPDENNIYENSRQSRDNNRPQLSVELRDKYAYSGDIITYKISITNNSGKDINNLNIENIYDNGLNFISNSSYPAQDTTSANRMEWRLEKISADSGIVYYYESKICEDTFYIGKTLNSVCLLTVSNKLTASDTETDITVIAGYPLPPENFQAQDFGNGNILLTFDKSISPNIKEYKIYSDNGSGIIDYSVPIIVIPAGDTASYSFYKNDLQTEKDYLFGVRATDNNLFEEKNSSRIVKINSCQIESVETELHAYIKHPQPLQKITGNGVNIMAELYNNNDSIIFETTNDFADELKNNFENSNAGNPVDYIETSYLDNNLTVIVYTKEIEPDKIADNIFTVFKMGITEQVSQIEYSGIKKGFYSYTKMVTDFDLTNDKLHIYLRGADKKNKTDRVKQILFQMKNINDNIWFDIPAVKTTRSSGNPDYNYPYFVLSDFTMYSAGFYNLRAVVTDINDNVDVNPPQITIEINHTDADTRKNLKYDGLTEVSEKLNQSKNNEISISAAADNPADDMNIKLNLPAGSFDTDAVIIMEVLSADTQVIQSILEKNSKQKLSGLLEINFSDTSISISDTNPLELIFAYIDNDNNNVIDGTTVNVFEMSIWTYSRLTSVWEKLPNRNIDTEHKEITAYAKHFSLFALFSDKSAPASISLNNVTVFPNPFKPNDGLEETGKEFFGTADVNNKTGVHIIGLTADAVITIYDILGRRVKELTPIANSGMAIWDARYEDGREAGSGIYIIVVKSGSEKIVRKAALVR